jgi:ATPase family associated with various cellular activities (AAA)
MDDKVHTASDTTAARVLRLVRLQARRLSLWAAHLRQRAPAEQDAATGTPAAVARILESEETERERQTFFGRGAARALGRQVEAAGAALADDPAWRALCETFCLSPEEAELLTLLVALDLDPRLSAVLAFLSGDEHAPGGTPWMAARLAARTPAPSDTSNLRAWLLATPLNAGAPERLMTLWQADPTIAGALTSGTWHDGLIVNATSCASPADIAALPGLQPVALNALNAAGDVRDLELVGPHGSGRQTLAAQFAGARAQALLCADLKALAATPLPALEAITRVLRLSTLTGALAYFRNAEAATAADWQHAQRLGVAYLRGVRHPGGQAQPIVLKPLTIHERVSLWRQLSSAPAPERVRNVRLTPLELHEAARGRPCYTPRPDHGLLSLLPTPYGWEDLVMEAEALAQLRALESQIRLRWPVYEEWGFGRLTHLGQGIAALFCGPSGTGKTMAAQVLARALGLDLLRVDLAGVVNKYVGETEKRLREVFDACEDSNALLFFDEADALFGNRTQVRDAHDRFANIEIDFLLQAVERFDGITLLGTSRRADLDPAFVRRLRFVIEFLPPRPPERLTLWQRALPLKTPDGQPLLADIDFGYLSQRLAMTGAQIKNTALNAAFLARAESKLIGMPHVLAAAQRELAKQGQHTKSTWGTHAHA